MYSFHNTGRAALVWAALLVWCAATPATAEVQVSADGDLLNIKVSEAANADAVLQQIGKALGAKVEGACSKRVGPFDLTRITFKQALENVATECSFIIERQGETGKIKRILLVEGLDQNPAPGMQGNPQQPDAGGQPNEAAQQQAEAMQQGGMAADDQQRNNDAMALRDIAKFASENNSASRAQLDRLARTHASVTVRAAALRTLATFATQGPAPFLETRLLTERDPQSRLAAAQALVQVDFDRGREAITKAAATERDPGIREQLKAIIGE